MTAGRTNHTKFAAAPPAPELHIPEEYRAHLMADRRARDAWLLGSWDLHGDTRPDELRCTLCLREGHAAADCPRAALLRGR